MIQWVRSVLGLQGSPVKRMVLGNPVDVDLKEARHIQNSDNRLKLLQTLCNQYKGTPHEHKINLVYEKTKNIHTYLVDQKKSVELELFHLQNTDHFINTFSLIKAAHAKAKAAKTLATETGVNQDQETKPAPDIIKPAPLPQPDLSIPAIAIDTFTPVKYLRFGTAEDFSAYEISLTSNYEEKEYFLATIAARVGVYKPDITYVGNTQVNLPDSSAGKPAFVPVISWRGSLYAVNLNNYRLFPVRINRNGR